MAMWPCDFCGSSVAEHPEQERTAEEKSSPHGSQERERDGSQYALQGHASNDLISFH